MQKKVTLICLIFLITLFAPILVRAESSAIFKSNNNNYEIKTILIENSRVILNVNGDIRTLDSIQSSQPYYVNHYSTNTPELKYILKTLFAGEPNRAEMILMVENNFTEENPHLNLTIDGKSYQIEMIVLDHNRIALNVNGDIRTLDSIQPSQPYYVNHYSTNTPELKYVLKTLFYSPVYGASYATLIFGFDVNLTNECTEDWICTNWSPCEDNQQTRTCTDSNSCGTTENKPLESQSCSAPTPDIECHSDDDCMIEGTGQPYCDRNKLCIPSMSYECKNDGTEESYCTYPETLDCTICENGCENAECIANPTSQPQKECEQIGLRQTEKYCSSQYKLINQKIEESSCENNFECKSNICKNGKCGESKFSNLIYWIIGIIIIVILFIFIIYSIAKRQ